MRVLLIGWLAQGKRQDLLLLGELVIEEEEKRSTKRNDFHGVVNCIFALTLKEIKLNSLKLYFL